MDTTTDFPLESAARDEMLMELGAQQDLPALGKSINTIVELSTSETRAVQEVTSFVLSDPGLTQKILRLANSACYRNHTGSSVSTISRAIFLLGLDTVRSSALAMTMAENIGNSRQSHAVRSELLKSFYASAMAREVCRIRSRAGSEEPVIAALFSNLGQLMTAAYAYDKYAAITSFADENNMLFEKAAAKILGCSFSFITEKILQNWSIPDGIISATLPVNGTPKNAKLPNEFARMVASFSAESAQLLYSANAQDDTAELQLMQKYGVALDLTTSQVKELFATVAPQAESLMRAIGLGPAKKSLTVQEKNSPLDEVTDLSTDFLLAEEGGAQNASAFYPSGKPHNAKDLLLSGISEMSLLGMNGAITVNDSVLHVMETLYRGLGFRCTALFFKDSKSKEYKPRLALGDSQGRWKNQLSIAMLNKQDVFGLALAKAVDIVINDTSQTKIASLLPKWHQTYFFDAKSFLILPIVINNAQLGFFYADRLHTAEEGITTEEAALIKILKNQVVAVLLKK